MVLYEIYREDGGNGNTFVHISQRFNGLLASVTEYYRRTLNWPSEYMLTAEVLHQI